MKVVLLKDDKRYGKKGDVVSVSDGFASNYLLPNKIALPATSTTLNEAKQLKESEQHKQDVLLTQAKEQQKQLQGVTVVLTVKVGENGKVFGSVTSKEIAGFLSDHGVELDKKKIDLPNPIKSAGQFVVKAKLHPQVTANITVVVNAAK